MAPTGARPFEGHSLPVVARFVFANMRRYPPCAMVLQRAAITYKREGIIRISDSEDDREPATGGTRRKIVRPCKRHRRPGLSQGQRGRKVHHRDAGDDSDFLKRLRKTGLNLDMIARRRPALSPISAPTMVMAGGLAGGSLSARYLRGGACA